MTKITKSRRRVYMSIAAQPDNLGDIAIRQAAIDMLSDSRAGLVIFAGSMPEAYIAAFEFPPGVELIRSQRRFATRLLGDVLRTRADLVFAPGPLQLRSGARPALKSAANLMNVLLVRLSGGKVIALGRSLRGQGKPALWIERAAISKYSLFSARDDVSAGVVSRPLYRTPDLAFLREVDLEGQRTRVAISLRGDRKTNPDLVSDVVSAVRSRGLEPAFVTQVGRDERQHQLLAASVDANVESWDGDRHGDQLRKVEEFYRTCQFVVSDRLHSLILGMLKGAIPIAVIHPNSDKLTSTLAGIITAITVGSQSDHAPEEAFVEPDARRVVLAEELETVKRQLAELMSELRGLVN